MDISKWKEKLESELSKYRYHHSLMVANEARDLAKFYHLDSEKAYFAGLIHDMSKELSDQEMKEYANKYFISDEFLLPENIFILHAEIGYYILKNEYHLEDEICNAVRYHTTGDIKMNLFDKIIFIADKIGRDSNPFVLQLKKIAYENIDEAMIYDLKYLKEKLEKEGKTFKGKSKELLFYLEN